MSAKEEKPDEEPLLNDSSSSLLQRFHYAQSLVENSSSEAIDNLTQLQHDIASLSLFSSNETLSDISTTSLPLLSVEYFLAQAYLQLPLSNNGGGAMVRKSNIQQSQTYFESFLNKLISLEGDLLDEQLIRDYHALLESSNNHNGDEETNNTPTSFVMSRDEKIARFRAKQELEREIQKLLSLNQRRSRLNLEPHDELEDMDAESLQRTLIIQQLKLYAATAISEWQQSFQELPMIDTMIRMEQEREDQYKHTGGQHQEQEDERRHPSNKPFQLTHITKDSTTGQLQIRKEELKSQVFRPGWNQPTMTLEELGEREYKEAQARGERQKQAEEESKNAPRRYEQLLRDGMEDNNELVDASAKLDRDWDEFREANPRGSGNKMGDRGDRNF